jgi:cobalt-precorrin 5A hydrolase
LSEPASDNEAMMIDVSGGPSAHPALSRPGLVAGIGLRAGAQAAELLTLLDTCLAAVASDRADLVAIATLESKAQHATIVAAARILGVPVMGLPSGALPADVPNPSPQVAALANVPSVAEAAALNFGPLMLEKQRSANCTCALSRYTPAGLGESSRAAIASSTLATSSAGP